MFEVAIPYQKQAFNILYQRAVQEGYDTNSLISIVSFLFSFLYDGGEGEDDGGEPDHDERAAGIFPTNKATIREGILQDSDAAKPQLFSKAPCGQERP